MNFKKISLVFCVGLVACTALRVLQIVKTVEYSNGFFDQKQKVLGTVLTVVIAVICAVVAFLANKSRIAQKHSPKRNILLSVSAVLVAVFLFNEAMNQAFPITMAPWQMGTIRLVTVICAGYFTVLAIKGVANIKMAPMVHVIPIAYATLKTIFTFISVSSLALISDNVLLMAAYCLLMLFFINYGKIYNGIEKERSLHKILWSGFAASLICVSQSAAYLLINAFSSQKYLHSDNSVIFTVLFMGVFISCFVASHFKNKEN